MRTEQEILQYLVIKRDTECLDVDKIIKNAISIEEKYADEISSNAVGYCLVGDFDNSPAEDEDKKLFAIEQIGELTVYSKSKDLEYEQNERDI